MTMVIPSQKIILVDRNSSVLLIFKLNFFLNGMNPGRGGVVRIRMQDWNKYKELLYKLSRIRMMEEELRFNVPKAKCDALGIFRLARSCCCDGL